MTETLQVTPDRVGQWRIDRASINHTIRDTRCWIAQAANHPQPPFAELGSRLRALREQLESHFGAAIQIYTALAEELWCIEVQSAQQIAAADQTHLLRRLESLIIGVLSVPPAYATFADAVDALEWIFDELDQYEEREADSFEWLLASQCG